MMDWRGVSAVDERYHRQRSVEILQERLRHLNSSFRDLTKKSGGSRLKSLKRTVCHGSEQSDTVMKILSESGNVGCSPCFSIQLSHGVHRRTLTGLSYAVGLLCPDAAWCVHSPLLFASLSLPQSIKISSSYFFLFKAKYFY